MNPRILKTRPALRGASPLLLLPVLLALAVFLAWRMVEAKMAVVSVGKPRVVAAPTYGRVETVHVKPGDIIEPGRELVGLVVTDAKGASGPAVDTGATREVTVKRLEGERFEDMVELPGTIEPRLDLKVAAQVGGRIVERPLLPGRPVRAGDLLARIEKRDYEIAAARARAGLDLAKASLERAANLVRENAGSKAERDRAVAEHAAAAAAAEAAELALSRCDIVSPIDGIVDRFFVEAGEQIDAGKPVARVIAIDEVKVTIGVPEQDVSGVRDATSLDFTVPSLAGERFTGRVDHLAFTISPLVKVFPLELRVANADGRLLPGMIVKARVVRAIHEKAILLPLFAVLPGDDGYTTFVHENGRAVRRAVKLGAFRERRVHVTEGLAVGEEVLDKGLRLVSDGSPVRVVR